MEVIQPRLWPDEDWFGVTASTISYLLDNRNVEPPAINVVDLSLESTTEIILQLKTHKYVSKLPRNLFHKSTWLTLSRKLDQTQVDLALDKEKT